MTRAVERLRASGGEVVAAGSTARANLPDMSVSSEEADALVGGGMAVWVDVLLPAGSVMHGGVRQFVSRHLDGRNPAIFEEHGYLRIGFSVHDHSPATLHYLEAFAVDVGRLFGTDDVFCTPVVLSGDSGQELPRLWRVSVP